MKTLLCSIVFATFAMTVVAASSATNASGRAARNLTPEERQAMLYARTGGFLTKTPVVWSKVAVIDTQSLADVQTNLMPVLTKYGEMTKTSVKFVYEKSAAAEPEALMATSKAVFAIVLVANDKDPAMAIMPEDRYAIVNTKKLVRGFKSIEARKELYDKRCAKASLKAAAMLLGCGGSKFKGNLLDTVKMEDLDLANLALPIDAVLRMGNYLNAAGIETVHYSTYMRACQEGWAPAPTNDIQKAIWDKVHEIPTKPIKIEFDGKKEK